MANSNPSGPPARAPQSLIWLGLLALAAYAVILGTHTSVVASGSDQSGYLNSAHLFAAGRLKTDLRTPAEFGPQSALSRIQFLPLGFWAFAGDPQITPTYPTGLPLHYAFAALLLGWHAGPLAVSLFGALGAIWLCYATGRELGLDAWLAAAGAAALGLCPVLLFTSVQPLSDTVATAWCLAAVWTVLRARRAGRWAVAGGAAFAIAVLVRPTNLLLLPALLVWLGWDWRRLLRFALGGLPGAAWLASYNHALYGGMFHSGYGDWFGTFALAWGPATAWHFLKWLALLLPAPLLVLPFAAFAPPGIRGRDLVALALWFVAITGLYTFYVVSHEQWWCLRFILPATPALILAGLLGVQALALRLGPGGRNRASALAALTIIVWAAGLSAFWVKRFAILKIAESETTFAKACETARAQLPPGTLIVTLTFSGAIYRYTDFPILRWDLVDTTQFTRLAALARKTGRQVAALNYRWEDEIALGEHCIGNWVPAGHVGDATFWLLTPPRAEAR